MASDLKELDRRNVSIESQYKDMFDAYISARMFDMARVLAKEHPSIDFGKTPEFLVDKSYSDGKPSELVIRSDRPYAILRSVDLNTNYRIVIVAECHVSRDAARAIEANTSLREAFKKGNAVWIQPADRTLNFEFVRQWNAEFPDEQISIAYRNKDWADIDFSRIPNFYIYKNGKLIFHEVGWWKNGSAPKSILKDLHDAGLLNS